MPTGVLITRLALSAIFIVAAVTKLLDRPGSQEAMRSFGVPEPVARVGVTVLPFGELAVAVALLPASTASWAAVGALLLISLFMVAILRSMALGETPDCHCFGQLHSSPVGWGVLARNALLAAGAALVIARGPGGVSATAWLARLGSTELAVVVLGGLLLCAVALGAAVALELLRHHGRLLMRIEALEEALTAAGVALPGQPQPSGAGMVAHGLSTGAPAPKFSMPDLDGNHVTLDSLLAAEEQLMLLFTHPHCGPCITLMPEVAAWQLENATRPVIVLISEGSVKDIRARRDEHGLANVLVQQGRGVADAYGVAATPAALLVSADGRVASAVHAGSEAIRSLVAASRDADPDVARQNGNGASRVAVPLSVSPGAELAVGTPAPAFKLRDLYGSEVLLERLHGRETLVVFWNPSCSFCQQMLGDLRALERRFDASGRRLLVVSAGTVEENLAMGLSSTVVLSPDFELAAAFGARGTPSAVLIDADGDVATGVAAGSSKVLDLARGGPQRTGAQAP